MNPPQPRPALRRADDADVHPALAIAPSQAPPTALGLRSSQVAPEPAAPRKKAGKPKGGGAKGAGAKAVDKAKGDAQRFRGAGKATSDVWRGASDKPVKLNVQIPKDVRKELRAVSKASDTSLDDLVTEILTSWLGNPRQW